jgi:pyrroline-5-carboxylate reductase
MVKKITPFFVSPAIRIFIVVSCATAFQPKAFHAIDINPTNHLFGRSNGTPNRNECAMSFNSADPKKELSVGFIGCGTIASAIATGLAMQDKVSVTNIAVTKRSEAKSSALQKSFGDLVSIHEDAQELVDQSDVVFVTVLPEQASQVLQEVTFDSTRHSLVSLVSTSTLDDLISDSGLPAENVSKMICLPAVAKLKGVSLVVPKQNHNPILLQMLESLGGYVECETLHQMNAMMVPTGMMGSFYGLLRNNRDWLVQQGVQASDASYFVAKQYMSMMEDAVESCVDPSRFDDLVEEQTPGGLNEQGLANLSQQGVFQSYNQIMDALLSRLEGRSDGSLTEK